jgi:hypothetical protein
MNYKSTKYQLLFIMIGFLCHINYSYPDSYNFNNPPACGSSVSSEEGPAINAKAECAIAPEPVKNITNPSMQLPDREAWNLFIANNRAAFKKQPFWLSWPEQSEVFPASPHAKNPPTWKAIADIEPHFKGRRSKQHEQRLVPRMTSSACATFNSGLEEVRINQVAFKYIIDNNLWFTQGKAARFDLGTPVSFPSGSREIKANWISQKNAKAALGHPIDLTNYFWKKDVKGNVWLLVAMHMIDRSIPNWLWSTFEHKDNPCFNTYLKAQDNFGVNENGDTSTELKGLFKKNGMNVKLWSNYRLDGAQTDFTLGGLGRPIIIGNSVTEYTFQTTASCMTCHSRATTDYTGQGSLSIFTPDGQSFNGVPDPSWFYSSFTPATLEYMPLDFLWSVALCPNAVGTKTQNCARSDPT